MFIAALLTTKKWEQHKCPSTDEQEMKSVYPKFIFYMNILNLYGMNNIY